MALILFIMVILSTAFTTGLQVFRQLKGLGLTISLDVGYRLSPRGQAYLRMRKA